MKKRKTGKLWQKVSVISVAVMVLVVAVCSALLLNQAKQNILDVTIEQTRIQQRELAASFSEMAAYYVAEETDPVVKESGIKYCFSRVADDTAVLTYGEETLYSSVSIKPEKILAEKITGTDNKFTFWFGYDTVAYPDNMCREEVIDGRHVLIAGGVVALPNDPGDYYGVFVVKDITGTYEEMATMTWWFVFICAASVVAGAVLIALLMRRATRPLAQLNEMTHHIAEGNYDAQVNIRTKDEVGELAANFNRMTQAVKQNVEQLEDMVQRQQLFVGGLTHEIKTPMTSMMLHTDTLLTADLGAAEAQVSLRHLYEQCRWMERLSQKLLKLTTLGEEIEIHPVKTQELFQDVAASTAEMLQARNTPLVMESEVDVFEADYDLMKSLLMNLVDNASKASEAGQTIRLRACETDFGYKKIYATRMHHCTIEVCDSGSGIPEEEIPRVTDAFYMVDRSRSKKAGGSGLGLALVQMIAKAHKADLVIESELGVGTTVKVKLSWPRRETPGREDGAS